MSETFCGFRDVLEDSTEARMYRYMEEIFNETFLDTQGLSETEFLQKFADVAEDKFTYEIEIVEDKVCFYMCVGDLRECIDTEKIAEYTALELSEQETRCMIAACILVVGGDRLFGGDKNPIRKTESLHKKLALEVRKKLSQDQQ